MKRRIILLAAISALCMSGTAHAGDFKYDVIPMPHSVKFGGNGFFYISEKTEIVCPDSSLFVEAGFLSGYIEEETGLSPEVKVGKPGNRSIVLKTDASLGREAYRMCVGKKGIEITGGSAAGVFYAAQTLRKSLAVTGELPEAVIEDSPAFGYRGAHLDISRHFLGKDDVKTYIDMMALHNMNVLHWHLTDDQGWRVEIKRYPRLVEVGSVRKETLVGHLHDTPMKFDGVPHGGYYTQDDIREVVEYAARRHVTVIPEVDLPGHMLAALASYPELGCTGGPYEVWTRWGISEDVLCAGNPQVYDFLDNVFSEIVELFPSEYIHIGGDECPKTQWKKCPKCQAMADRLGLQDDETGTREQKLQSHVMKHVSDFLNARGRRIIGWDEILEGEAAPGSTVMSWRGEKGGIAAARKDHDVIMTPNTYMYFDYYQSKDRTKEPLAIGGFIPLEKVYGYNPIPDALSPQEAEHIIGVQANLWTEYIATLEHVQYMVLPRWSALAENQWSNPDAKDYGRFLERLKPLVSIYRRNGYNYASHALDNR